MCIGRRLVRCWPWDVYSAPRVRGRAARRAGPCQLEEDSQCKQHRVKLGNRVCGQGRGTNFFFDPLLNSTTKNNPYRHAGRWLIWHPFYATLPNLEPGCFASCTADTKAPVCTSSDFLQAVLVDFKPCMSIFLFGIVHIIVDAWNNYWGCKSCVHLGHIWVCRQCRCLKHLFIVAVKFRSTSSMKIADMNASTDEKRIRRSVALRSVVNHNVVWWQTLCQIYTLWHRVIVSHCLCLLLCTSSH